jgi:hypothetical protein
MRVLLSGIFAIAFSAVVVAPALACGPKPLAAAFDQLLPEAQLPAEQIERAKALRVRMTTAMTAGDETAARKAEEEAMEMLGYRKAPMRCGPGSFTWMKMSEG